MTTPSHQQHQRAGKEISARCAVITLSDTRNEQTDSSGKLIQERLKTAGHRVEFYKIIRDEPAELEQLLNQLLARQDIDAVLTTGGTGISTRDHTIGVVERMLTQPLPGFGELFRMLSWDQIGSSAMMSRAIGGICQGKIVFCMPGSSKAVELAMTKLILPELGHLLFELQK
jgi:molybdenum cofactor biosynthesis protein B